MKHERKRRSLPSALQSPRIVHFWDDSPERGIYLAGTPELLQATEHSKASCAHERSCGLKSALLWLRLRRVGLLVTVLLHLAACRTGPPSAVVPHPPTPPAVASRAFRPEKLAQMDAAVDQAIHEKRLPGGVLWFEQAGEVYSKAYGERAVMPVSELMTPDTIFDAASLTKVIATTPAIMLLAERGRLRLDAPVQQYLPTFTGDGREQVSVRHLLTHTSGLRPGIPATPVWSGYEQGLERACAEKPTDVPDTLFRYSDINFILLGEIVRRVSGQRLDEFVHHELFQPLGMMDTSFLPPATKLSRVAPTTKQTNGHVLRAEVHDPTSRRLGGVAGHAGLFTTAADLARFARMMLGQGALDGLRVLKPETVRLMTSVQSAPGVPVRRGLGWDIDSPYAGPRGRLFPLGSYGHTGWTGTSLWIDPFSGAFLVFLSNRNHPTEAGNVIGLRNTLGTLAAEAIPDFNFAFVPGALAPRLESSSNRPGRAPAAFAETLNGIDVLVKRSFVPLKGRRIGLITNHTGTDRQRSSTIDLLFKADGLSLKALFSPEHGIRGLLDEKVSDGVDEKTGLPVYSLYGDTRKPKPEQLMGLDALVFDIQDIGCRFYTYVSTMGLAMEAAAASGLEFFVLDRVNPINGVEVEGPVYQGESSFTAFHAVPLRHGMTVGELARMFQAERVPAVRLTVIPLENWRRELWLDQTSLPWTNPSPNMRNLTEAILYPGVGLLETAVSVGRGTDTPFEVVGAPYINDVELARELNRVDLPGIRFVPVRFTPRASVFKDRMCGGVYLMLTDRDRCPVVDVGLVLAATLQRLYPGEFALEKVQILLQDRQTIDSIRAGQSVAEIKTIWAARLDDFQKRRERFLLYK